MKQQSPRQMLRKSGLTLRQFKKQLQDLVAECDCQCLDVELNPDEVKALLDQIKTDINK
jgi:hypothetical protein